MDKETKRIDDLGRVQIPKHIRKALKINEGDKLEISVVDELIIIKKEGGQS
jgi:transcriptional pleiotropic regulator of transition state genes